MGILTGVAGLGIHARSWWGTRLPVNLQNFLATTWTWVYGICLLNGVFLVVGSIILVVVFELNNPNLFVLSFLLAILLLLLGIFIGTAYDVQRGYRGRAD